MSNPSNCPYCGVPVEPTDTTCMNCFCDLRQQTPQRTMVTRPQDAVAPSPPAEQASPSPPPAAKAEVDTRRESGPTKAAGSSSAKRSKSAKKSAAPASAGPEQSESSADGATPYRPRLRPPMALLHIHDDDGKSAEIIRLRSGECVIGRTEGDVVIPHEKLMSGKHAKIARKFQNEHFRWVLADLGSTNGTFLRIQSGKLQHNMEIMIGAFRYRFNAAPQGRADEAEQAAEPTPQRTMGWQRVNPGDVMDAAPSLIRITPSGEADEFKFRGLDQVIGSGSGADVVIGDDPMISGTHVRIYQDEHGRWQIEDLDSRNGVWRAIKEKVIDMAAEFQLGEQRFSLRFV